MATSRRNVRFTPPLKADIHQHERRVRFVPKADIAPNSLIDLSAELKFNPTRRIRGLNEMYWSFRARAVLVPSQLVERSTTYR